MPCNKRLVKRGLGMQSLAQVSGPLLGGQLYTRLGAAVPFWTGAGSSARPEAVES